MIGPTATTPSSDEPLVSLADILSAAGRLKGQAVRTPIISALDLATRLGVPCGVKAESFQRTGSFKFRGAFNYVATMDPSARARGVIAPSSGNHGLAVACVASIFGVPATIVMPTTVTAFKRAGVERYGATTVFAGTTTDDRMSAAEDLARSTGAEIVPPYDDIAIITGQATCGLEIITDQPEASTLVVPVGGGGLSAGIAAVVKLSRPDAHIVAVEPDGAAKLSAAWRSGSPVRLDSVASAADGLLAIRIGARNFAHLHRYVDEVVTVSEKEIVEATAYMYRELKLVAEPSGATALAALLAGKVSPTGETIAVLSGGNISLDALRDYCAEV